MILVYSHYKFSTEEIQLNAKDKTALKNDENMRIDRAVYSEVEVRS